MRDLDELVNVLDDLIAACPEMIHLAGLVRGFASLCDRVSATRTGSTRGYRVLLA
ncbi:hypothetical protein ACQP1V_27580 [Microtetraspora malaysiensis]|uniref:hypothetical protein n=1 Tax=Microtetraspora malaysiensis TaxID=161358 RepID=UPI003D94908A